MWTAKGAELDGLVVAFDALGADDLYRAHTAALLAEQAIAGEQSEIVVHRLRVLRSIADQAFTSPDELTRRCAVRIRMCVADATGEWIELVREVQFREPPPIVAWVHARYARFLAVSGDGAGAQEQYLDAIERASTKEMFDEAAEWLYALRKVRWMYGMLPTDEQADEHSLARALRPHAKPSTLPGSQHTGELALGAMADETTPHEALQCCRLWRWQAVVRADLSEESHAVKGMGTLQGAAGCYRGRDPELRASRFRRESRESRPQSS